MSRIRPGESRDLPAIKMIQESSWEAPDWPVEDYSRYDLLVSEHHEQVVGFLVSRLVAPGETELLNLAVVPECRRQGVARELLNALLNGLAGAVFLEVRESNTPARMLYKSMGFQEVGVRPAYYHYPPESAIVMKFHSC